VLSASTEELLRYASTLIEETERELTALARTLGHGTWPDALARLREDRIAGNALADAYRQTMERARNHVRTHDLAPVPEDALAVYITPAYAVPWTPLAAYLPPGPLTRVRTGRLFVTPPDGHGTGEHPTASLASTAVHEGFPGHHLHFLNVYDSPRLARRFLLAPATVEGWALYCEGMMDETGFYATPEERFFALVALLWRALRIPLDIVHGARPTRPPSGCSGPGSMPAGPRRGGRSGARTSPAGMLGYAVGRRNC
jgi:uncharacterized protein (DUF885 family)